MWLKSICKTNIYLLFFKLSGIFVERILKMKYRNVIDYGLESEENSIEEDTAAEEFTEEAATDEVTADEVTTEGETTEDVESSTETE